MLKATFSWSTTPTWWKGIFNPDLEYELSSWTDRPTWTVKLKCWVCLFNLKVSTQSWVKIVSWQFVSYGCFFFIGWFLARATRPKKIPPSKKEVPQEWVTLRPGLLTGWTLSTNQLESRTKSHTYSWGLLFYLVVRRAYSCPGVMMYSCYYVTVVPQGG